MQQFVLQEIITQLETCNIQYMLSGSMALCVYTTPRFTRDFDIVVAIDTKAVEQLALLWSDKYY